MLNSDRDLGCPFKTTWRILFFMLLTIQEGSTQININLYPNPVNVLQGFFPGRSAFINGYGNDGSPMVYCPSNCSDYEIFGTHSSDSVYAKFWDKGFWTDPVYSKDSAQETQAGLGQGSKDGIQEGVSVFCKKPYAVCDYPGGDIYARAKIEQLLVKTSSSQCLQSMKLFLCTLYRRKCLDNVDQNPNSPTFRRRGVFPVCFAQCQNAYLDCGFGNQHMALTCGEYIKAGWVQYSYVGSATGECDSKGFRASSVWWGVIWFAVGTAILLVMS